MARIPSVANGLLLRDAAALVVGSPAWFAWLADDARSFSFRSTDGTYTARKEHRRRGGAYWVAYRTAAGSLHKAYLGKAEELTPERLKEAAAVLAGLVADSPPSAASAGAPGTGTADRLLLATKLFAPRARPDLVARPRLLARLDAGLDGARCTLLSAPAGAGKTTLLASWLARLERRVAWLALDERDQDPHQFLRYLIAGLQSIAPACGRAALARLEAPPPPRPEMVLTSLLNDLAALPQPCLLVLDDYHLVHAPAIHQMLAFLLDHLPPAVHLVIATREDPPLPLPRLRARGQLAELRAGDLRFTADEAASFLGERLGLRLSNEQVAALVERTEGWAAGLQLAGLALRDRPDAAAFVATFAQGHRLVADYLTAEVLERQPASTQRFLLATSVLDRLCAPLCDALLAPGGNGADAAPAGDSRQVLEALERANLFLVPLDDEQRWYRYHHLFADVLRARLAREAGAGAAAALHRRASAWFGREGLLPEAIQHALAGGAVEDAATWIETLSHTGFANAGVRPALRTWLAAVPEPVVRARPWLCLAQAWLGPEFPRGPTTAWVDAAEQALAARADADGRQARGAIAATRAFLATAGSVAAPARARVLAEQALADLRPDEPGFHVASVSLGRAALQQGQLEQAERAFAEAAAAGQAAGFVHLALLATSQHVAIARIRGSHRRALSAARAALAWAHEANTPEAPGVGLVSVLVSDLLRDANDLEAALPLATDGLRALRQYDDPPLLLLASLSLVWLRLARGEVAEAAAVLADARPLVQHAPCTALAPLLDAGAAQVHLAGGDVAAAVAWATASEPLPLQDSMAFGGHGFAAGLEAMGVAATRILAAHGRATGDTALLHQAAVRLEPACQLAERQGLGWLRLKALILRALLDDDLGDRDAALAALAAAVAQAEPEGYIRPFLDEGGPLAALMAALRASERGRRDPTGGPSPAYLDALLAAFDRQASTLPSTRTAALVEQLSARELDVLRLLAAGRSNAEMARVLVLEQSTVKTHLIHLYGKLGVHSRTQAVARAHELRLLDDAVHDRRARLDRPCSA